MAGGSNAQGPVTPTSEAYCCCSRGRGEARNRALLHRIWEGRELHPLRRIRHRARWPRQAASGAPEPIWRFSTPKTSRRCRASCTARPGLRGPAPRPHHPCARHSDPRPRRTANGDTVMRQLQTPRHRSCAPVPMRDSQLTKPVDMASSVTADRASWASEGRPVGVLRSAHRPGEASRGVRQRRHHPCCGAGATPACDCAEWLKVIGW